MPRLLVDIAPLRESPQFRRLWAGSTLSAIGTSLTGFAVTLQVYNLTRSPFAVGVIGLALNTMTSSIMLVIGLALAGIITGTSHLGLRGCYLIDSLTFVASLYGIARLPTVTGTTCPPKPHQPPIRHRPPWRTKAAVPSCPRRPSRC